MIADFNDDARLPEALYQVARQYQGRQKYEQAIELYQYIADNWPESDRALPAQMNVAISNIALGDDAAAEAAIDRLIADFNDEPDLPRVVFVVGEEYYYKAVFLRENEGLYEEAKEYYRKTLAVWERIIKELPPSPPYTTQAYYFSARCYRHLGEYENAIEYYQIVVSNWPDYQYAWGALFKVGRIYEKMKKSGVVSKSQVDAEIKAVYEQLLEKYPTCKGAKHAQYWLCHHK